MPIQSTPVQSSPPPARRWWLRFKNNRTLLLMCLPAIIFFFVFAYIPMPGLYLAFVRYNYTAGIFKSPFVGFDNFKFLVLTGDLWRLTRNTVLYNLAFILCGNFLQIFVALLLNEIYSRWFKKTAQTIMFLPHFISFVLVGLFAYNFLSYDFGVLNGILRSFGYEPVKAYSNPVIWKYIIVATYLWKTTGYGSIIYFAAIMNLDMEIVEAAHIDGANAFQRIRYIIIPWLKPTFIILLLFSLGAIMRGNFELFFNLVGASNSLLYESTDIIETFVFRSLMTNFNFSMGSAVSLYQSFFGLITVLTANWLVKKIDPEYGLF
ncbi:binding-protein-dependent transport system inner membrane component [Candidatus Moduliflexus flocculans]|uniref:Binding-protein-dependent transport system inner membrane component n=1 Tax=Candidatus Moduliflexus flocculans TaxID=1499966 RepID=A0A081BQ58_9BACT|nr:binding-protein-dependent transport system inner membrane component [Candidatus Moduliflexus flocculans]